MMQVKMMLAALLLLSSIPAFTQVAGKVIGKKPSYNQPIELKGTVVPMPIQISGEITTNLIFPYSIVSVDRGSRAFIAQKPQGADNILQVKATTPFEQQTNLTVVTTDGGFYSFLVTYDPKPVGINLRLSEAETDKTAPIVELSEGIIHQNVVQRNAQQVFLKRPSKIKSVQSSDMGLELSGIYIAGDVLYFRLTISNAGYIPYDLSQFRVFVRDRKIAKRTASQEIALLPVIISGPHSRVDARSDNVIVIGLPKFTIPDKKRLHFQLMEKDGGRNLELRIKNKQLMKVERI